MLKHIGSNWALNITTIAVMLVLSPFMAQVLGKGEYGVWIAITAATAILDLLALGVPMASVRFISEHLAKDEVEEVNTVFSTGIAICLATGVVVIALGALRMVHDLCAGLTEKGVNTAGARYGYSVDGFAASLKEGTTREAVDACLQEIAATTDVLGYIESPYARLAICWGSAMIGTLKRVPLTKTGVNASGLGPRATGRQNPVQRGPSGRAPDGKEHRSVRFAEAPQNAV